MARGNRTLQFLRDLPPGAPGEAGKVEAHPLSPFPAAAGASVEASRHVSPRSTASPRAAKTSAAVAGAAPTVSVIIAARNEARNLRQALLSVLAQEYDAYEVLAVDDRSTDRTGAILDELARRQERLRVLHVSELPPGWLGKNHALHQGALHSRGELLLFTDADVVMEPTVLRRATRFLLRERLDHLTVFPRLTMPGVLLNWLAAAFGVFFISYTKPWKARDAASRCHLGIGAFNLLRRGVYDAIGTHRAIAMRPDDDVKLGKLVKKSGFRQEVLLGQGMLAVEWYTSLREMIDGLMKNAFAGIDYRLSVVIASTLALLLVDVWPFAALAATDGLTRLLNGLILLSLVLLCWDNARFYGMRPWYGLGFPLAALVFLYILWRSAIVTLRNHGITWRDTWYPLDELKMNKV
ncbi:MAG: glycosyltransferase [Candidatus Tectomicrobia bacterium]|nr:glycosyltransferase [Candidatus Tectomicrobia bacterium]